MISSLVKAMMATAILFGEKAGKEETACSLD
jgi:hypothetical protein